MELSYFGAGCILINTKQLSILVDPPDPKTGIKLPTQKVDVTLLTQLQPEKESMKDRFLIASPGEYEIQGVTIQGVGAQLHIDKKEDPFRGVMYVIGANDLRCLVTGNIAPELKDQQTEALGEVNIMVIPVGGKGLTLDATAAANLVNSLEPQYAVPVHYSDGKTKYEIPQDDLKPFLKEVGSEDTKPEAKLKVSAKELGEDTKIVVLERQ